MSLDVSLGGFITEYNIISRNPSDLPKTTQGERSPASQPSLSASAQGADRFSLEHFRTPKLGDAYTKSDVLLQLWKDAHSANLNNPSCSIGICFDPTEEDLTALEEHMRSQSRNDQINFGQIANHFANVFSTVHAGNLGDAIDYLASRAVALEGRINQNFSGEERGNQARQLDDLIQQGTNALTDSYAGRIQSALNLSEPDTQKLRSSLEAHIAQRIHIYQGVQAQLPDTLTGTGDEWLLDQDQYMASQLRDAAGGISDSAKAGELALGDLRAAGELAGAYQAVYQRVSQGSGGDEAFLALDLGIIDMKMETLIQKGMVGESMSGMLRSSVEQRHQAVMDTADQRHQAVMDTADQRLSVCRAEALSGQGPIPNLSRDLFQSIYNAVLGSFQKNGGDALAAIRDGAAFGKTATAQAGQKNPKVSRWGVSKADYWDKFYTSREISSQYGGKRAQRSAYQSYVDSWQHFLSTISSFGEHSLDSTSQEIPSYSQHFFVNTTV